MEPVGRIVGSGLVEGVVVGRSSTALNDSFEY
jgi:hypothetical protein